MARRVKQRSSLSLKKSRQRLLLRVRLDGMVDSNYYAATQSLILDCHI